jgi:hypothetical protein
MPSTGLPFPTVSTSEAIATGTNNLGGFVNAQGDQVPYFNDVDGSYTQTASSEFGSNKAQRKVLCNWVDKDQMIKVFLGYVDSGGVMHYPDFFPGTNMYCQSISVSGYGKMTVDDNGVLQYTAAELTLDYTGQAIPQEEGSPITLYDEEISTSENTYALSTQKVRRGGFTRNLWYWVDSGKPVPEGMPIAAVREIVLDVKLHFYRRKTLNSALFANTGLINSNTVTMLTTGIVFPAETLRFGTTTYRRSVQSGTDNFYDFTVHLQQRVARANDDTGAISAVSWNKFFNPESGQYDSITVDGGPYLPFGTPVSFSFLSTL